MCSLIDCSTPIECHASIFTSSQEGRSISTETSRNKIKKLIRDNFYLLFSISNLITKSSIICERQLISVYATFQLRTLSMKWKDPSDWPSERNSSYRTVTLY